MEEEEEGRDRGEEQMKKRKKEKKKKRRRSVEKGKSSFSPVAHLGACVVFKCSLFIRVL